MRNQAGKPQSGATIEIFSLEQGALLAVQTAITDTKGSYSVGSLLPGEYFLRVTAPSFLPTLREHVKLASDSRVVLNLTLNTLFRADQMLPPRRSADEPSDDWKWTLRSSANRAVLRVFDDQQTKPVETASDQEGLSARLAFMAGGGFDGLGGMPSVTTDFDVKQVWDAGNLNFRGNVGYAGRDPDGVLRVSYLPKQSADGAPTQEISLLVRRASVESPHLANSAVTTFGLSFSQTTRLLDLIDAKLGARLENSSVVGRQVYVEPLVDTAVAVAQDGRLYYRQGWQGGADDDLSVGPRLSYTPQGVAMERGLHQEAGYEHRWHRHHFGIAYYHDLVHNLALTGMGQMDMAGPDTADEILAGSDLESFTANVGKVRTHGLRVQWDRQWGTVLRTGTHVNYGTVLDSAVAPYAEIAELRSSLYREMRPGFGGDVVLKLRETEIETSYNTTLGGGLTPVDASVSRMTATAPYWNLKFSQPLPSFLPAHMQAVVDIRNLLAQGYRPVLGQDGRTLYLVQAPRALRAGLAFTF